jgi:cytochrome c-type biogenesis protein CcmE
LVCNLVHATFVFSKRLSVRMPTCTAMKKSHILAIGIIIIAIGILISASKDVTTYADFSQATQSGDKVKLIGQLVKDRPVEYDPEKNADYLAFYLRDDKGEVRRVELHAAKPQDFERSESIVLTGEMKGEVFAASDMLLKCPSKYKDQEIYVREKQG